MIEMQQIEALSQQIAEQFTPNKIILFGSYAQGEPTKDSDVDLRVILPFEGYPFRQASVILGATDPDFAVDLLVRTPAQLQQRLTQGDGFMQDILATGRVLYEVAHPRMAG